MQDLENKVAVITGGASGIGYAMAENCSARGMKVVIGDIEAEALAKAQDQLRQRNADVTAVECDVALKSEIDRLRDEALSAYGAVHLVHNNAGVGSGGPIWEASEGDWKFVMDINLMGVAWGIKTFVPLLLEQGEGHLINTASMAGIYSPSDLGVYNASKFAVVAMTESLARDLAEQPKINASVLCPSLVATQIGMSGRNRDAERYGNQRNTDPEAAENIQQALAMGMSPRNVAERVMECVLADELYIFTHPHMRELMELRCTALREAFDSCDRSPAVKAARDANQTGEDVDFLLWGDELSHPEQTPKAP